jgi:hypothetical protein
VKHYTAPAADSSEPAVKSCGKEVKDGLEHIDIPQTVSGGLQGTTELRILDGQKRSHEDHVFGKVEGQTLWVKLDEIEEDFLKEDWLPEMTEGKGFIKSWVRSTDKTGDKEWQATQVSLSCIFMFFLSY